MLKNADALWTDGDNLVVCRQMVAFGALWTDGKEQSSTHISHASTNI